jgi:hypothetical protein
MAGSPQRLLGRTVEGGDTSPQPTTRGSLLAQALGAWLGRDRGVVAVRCTAVVAQTARAHQWPMWGKVDGTSTKGVQGTRRARRSLPRLTEAVGRQQGGRVRDGYDFTICLPMVDPPCNQV